MEFVKAIFLLSLAVFFINSGLEDRAHNKQLAEHGKTAVIAPIATYTEETRTKLGIEVGKSQKATIQFKTETGEVIEQEKKMPKDVFEKIQAAQFVEATDAKDALDKVATMKPAEVTVTYLPEQPSVFIFSGHPESLGLLWLGLGMLLFGGFTLFDAVKKLLQKKSAAAH